MGQYDDFFRSYRGAIDSGCSRFLNSYRDEAFDMFRNLGFPRGGTDDYSRTDVAELLSADFGFYLEPFAGGFDPARVFRCDVPDLDSYKYFSVNGHFFKRDVDGGRLPGGVFAGDLNEFADLHPDIFKKYYNCLAAEWGSGLTAFNTAFLKGGFALYVPDGVSVDKVVQLTDIDGGSAVSLVNRRLLVILGDGASARLLVCDHSFDGKPASAATQVAEVYAGRGARFDCCDLEESGRGAIRLAGCFVRQDSGSEVTFSGATLSNGVTRNDMRVELAGIGASLYLSGMAIADGRQRVDNHTVISHTARGCRSEEVFRYVLDGEAEGVFSGRTVVGRGAEKTVASQSNRNLLLNDSCRVFSRPVLEIHADDVKCSHGMATGRLDEGALFYMQSRGIPYAEAVFLLKSVFMTDIVRRIPIDGLREKLRILIGKRFRGELATCRGCRPGDFFK
jgi:Fe-S cluster assembly protein SufD